LAAAVQLPPLDTLADQVLALHMAQHIAIGDIASLLIVLGLTGPVIQPLLRIRATRPLRRLTHPIIALSLWTIDLYAWHLPLLYQLADRHDLVHALEHACFLWFGSLLWLALIGPMPKPAWFSTGAQLAYVVGVRLVGAVLGNVLIWTHAVLYPIYKSTDAARGLDPLSDQTAAGGVMMVEQMILTIVLLAWLFHRFVIKAEERQSLLDLASAHGMDLTDERAARAAAAGRSELLRARLLGAASADARGKPTGPAAWATPPAVRAPLPAGARTPRPPLRPAPGSPRSDPQPAARDTGDAPRSTG
jgi:putative membrane protein